MSTRELHQGCRATSFSPHQTPTSAAVTQTSRRKSSCRCLPTAVNIFCGPRDCCSLRRVNTGNSTPAAAGQEWQVYVRFDTFGGAGNTERTRLKRNGTLTRGHDAPRPPRTHNCNYKTLVQLYFIYIIPPSLPPPTIHVPPLTATSVIIVPFAFSKLGHAAQPAGERNWPPGARHALPQRDREVFPFLLPGSQQ